jgi:hypothetical protein
VAEIANLDFHPALRAGNGTEISRMAVAANPDWRAFGQRTFLLGFKPFVKFDRAPSHNTRAPSAPS